MNEQWTEVTVAAPYLEGYAWAGLLIVFAYDVEVGGSLPDQFEIWHQASGELMLEVHACLARTQRIAVDVAKIADWAALSTTDEMMLQARLMAFAAGYPGEASSYNEWTGLAKLDRIIPYGQHY